MKNELPKTIKAFAQHGVFVSDIDGDEMIGTCPFCGKQRHFNASAKTQLWDCKKCMRSGNLRQFLERRVKHYQKSIAGPALSRLAKHRKLRKSTLLKWGVGYDPRTEWYMIPLYKRGKLADVHRYDPESGKSLATDTCKGGMFIVPGTPSQKSVAVCEGQWDAMAMWEAVTDDGRQLEVWGVAGASRIPKDIGDAIADKDVMACFDHDEAGAKADARLRKIAGALPRRLRSVHWPDKLEDKYDLRDHWTASNRNARRFFKDLESLLREEPVPIPKKESEHDVEAEQDSTAPPPQPTGKGLSRAEVLAGYRKWLYIPDSEIDVLDVAFGSAFANRLDVDPIWLFLVGPPGSLKTEIIESLENAPLTTLETDITRQSLVSGMQTLSGNDPSLIPFWNGKIVCVSDFTTILSMNVVERDAIFGILRSAYDGRFTKKFGNGVVRKYRSRFGMICGVTPVIERFGPTHSVVGERFVKYYVAESAGRLRSGGSAVAQALHNRNKKSGMRDALKELAAKALDREVDVENPPQIPADIERRFCLLAQWTAAVRGVVSRDKYTQEVEHKPVIERATRLVQQLANLATGVAIFRRRRVVGYDEFRIAARVARDSAPDRVEEIVHRLYVHADREWTDAETLAKWARFPKATVEKMLQNMFFLRLVEARKEKLTKQYRLSSTMRQMMQPLDLYTKEKQWTRARAATPTKPAKTRRTRRAKKGSKR